MDQTKPIKNLLTDTTIEEKKIFLNSFDNVLSDCDGVVWSVWGAINGVGDGINKLKDIGKSFAFISNNSIRSEADYLAKFNRANIRDVSTEDIFTPAIILALYLKQINFNGLIYALGSTEFRNILKKYGFSIIETSDEPIEESFAAIWNEINNKHPIRAVVVDTDVNVNYIKLTKAMRYLMDPECLFIVGATEMLISINDDLQLLGPGLFTKMIEEVSGRQATIVGKPSITLRDIIMNKLKIKNSNRVLMIGDTPNQDIGFGKACGFRTLLVLSGGTSLKNLQNLLNDETPDYYLDSLADFVAVCNAIQ